MRNGSMLRRTSSAFVIYFFASSCCIAWSWWAKKDINWDFLNYHLYAGNAALTPRWNQDFLAASIQSYLNPYAYVPFALMLGWNCNDLVISAALAALHALNVLLIWRIACLLFRLEEQRCRKFLVFFSVVLSASAPIFLQEIGSSFIDITTAIPSLAAIYMLITLKGAIHADRVRLVCGGVFLGIAAGLKLTNVPFGTAFFLALLVCYNGSIVSRLTAGIFTLGGGLFGAVLIHGYWGFTLWSEFGNPFFPFFNSIFRSPDFIPQSLIHYRFQQQSLWDSAHQLLKIVLPERGLYTEPGAPDLRVPVTILLVISVLSLRLKPLIQDRTLQPQRFVLVGTGLAYFLWLLSSGNGRYAMPLLLLSGPVVVMSTSLMVSSRRIVLWAMLLLTIVQLGTVALGADRRWNPNQWEGAWVDVDVPPPLREHSHFYLSLDLQPSAFLSAYVHPASGFTNISGQYVLGPGVPGYSKLASLLIKYKSRVRMLAVTQLESLDGRPFVDADQYAGILARVGYSIDTTDCAFIKTNVRTNMRVRVKPPVKPSLLLYAQALTVPNTVYISCAVHAIDALEMRRYVEKVHTFDSVFNHLEDACPKLLSPRRPITEMVREVYIRKYVNSDIQLSISNGAVSYRGWRGGEPIPFGSVKEVMDKSNRLNCTSLFRGGISDAELDLLMQLR